MASDLFSIPIQPHSSLGRSSLHRGVPKTVAATGYPHPTILMPPTMTCISKSYLETPRRSSSCVWYLFGQLRIRGLEHWNSWGCDGMSFVPSLHYVDIGQMAGHSANRCWISSRIRAEPASYTRPGKNSLSLLPCAASPVSDKLSWMLMGSCLTACPTGLPSLDRASLPILCCTSLKTSTSHSFVQGFVRSQSFTSTFTNCPSTEIPSNRL
ncbi:hypothetical protein B0H14DRAFT_475120 [Mycena olivaceomarginata]|nr:hypothetical protein B0H14DRAFT_475120 [Mycena olivaceomarginata]